MDGSLMATFTRREDAGGAAARLREAHPDLDVTVGDAEDALDALAINQRAEFDDAAVVPPSAVVSGPMMRGGLTGAAIGFVVGAIVILPILLLVDWPENDRGLFVITVAIIGGLAKMLDYWEGEARVDGVAEEIIQAVAARLRSYEKLSPEGRAESLKGLWKRIGDAYPEAGQKPQSQQPQQALH